METAPRLCSHLTFLFLYFSATLYQGVVRLHFGWSATGKQRGLPAAPNCIHSALTSQGEKSTSSSCSHGNKTLAFAIASNASTRP